MKFGNLRGVRFIPNEWFSESIGYAGPGLAGFESPFAVIGGDTTITVNVAGEVWAQMDAPRILDCESPARSVVEVLSGHRRARADQRSKFKGSVRNPCVRLEVATVDGPFWSDEVTVAQWNLKGRAEGPDAGVTERLSFRLWSAQFNNWVTAGQPVYWVMPLLNFLSGFVQQVGELARHPLRVYPTPDAPEDLTPEEATIADRYLSQKNRLIVFDFGGEQCFIERVPGYDEREQQLRAEHVVRCVTSVVVGTLASRRADQVREWLPFDILDLLGLATGASVGCPWVEIRDEKAVAVSRVHLPVRNFAFAAGHRPIDEGVAGTIGQLLTSALASTDWGTPHLRVALRQLVRGASPDRTLEDRLDHVCRGIEGLCKHLGLTGQNLVKQLSPSDRNAVRRIAADAAAAVAGLASQRQQTGDHQSARWLTEIANRTRAAVYVDASFGSAVLRLLERFAFHDATVVAQLYGGSKAGARSWAGWLSKCRSICAHGRSFSAQPPEHEARRAYESLQHLTDILTRAVLSMIGYTGAYQPAMLHRPSPRPLDWVQPDADPVSLGYRYVRDRT